MWYIEVFHGRPFDQVLTDTPVEENTTGHKRVALLGRRQGSKTAEKVGARDVGKSSPAIREVAKEPGIVFDGAGTVPCATVREEGVLGIVECRERWTDAPKLSLSQNAPGFLPGVGEGDRWIMADGLAPALAQSDNEGF